MKTPSSGQFTRFVQGLWHLSLGHRPLLGAAAIAMIAASLLLLIPPLLAAQAIDQLLAPSSSNLRPLLIAAVLSVAATLVAGVTQYFRGRWTALASEGIARQLRCDLYLCLQNARAIFFDRSQTGDLVQRCSSDVDTVRMFIASNLVDLTHSSILLITITPVLFFLDPVLAAGALCLLPLQILGSVIFFSRVRQLFEQTDEAESRMTTCLQENLSGIRVVRAFNRQDFEQAKFAVCIEQYRDCNTRMMYNMSVYWSISDLITFSQLGLVLIVGAHFVDAARLSIGELFAFLSYVGMVIWPTRHLGRVLVDSGKAIVALKRIEHILDQPAEVSGLVPDRQRSHGALKIHNLSFTYPVEKDGQAIRGLPALSQINLEIGKGETVAIVGPPGCGKSTLLALLLKLHNYEEGSIKIDGLEVATLDRHWLRSQFAVVSQEPFLYSRSVSENLRLGKMAASDEQLHAACSDAALHESIMQFIDHYDSLIGERGVSLSGGQRQRLALARAFLVDAPFLILDDALSAVDTQTEKLIVDALKRRSGKQSTLIITHRLSTVAHADTVIVMEQGRIVQRSTPLELADQSQRLGT